MYVLLLSIFICSSPGTILDQDAVPGSGARWLSQARTAYDELRLDEARIALDRALRDPSNARQDLLEIYRLKGLVEASMGQPLAAKSAFARVIVLDPKLDLPAELSPKILNTWEAARASLPGERGISIETVAQTEVLMASDAEIAIKLNDTLGMVEQIEVRYHIDAGDERSTMLTRADRGLLHIPASDLPLREQNYVLTLEAIAQNAFGAEIARLDSSAEKANIHVVKELSGFKQEWYEQWWVWAIVTGSVTAVALAGGISALLLFPTDTAPRDIGVVVE